jgi:hypothetical protein
MNDHNANGPNQEPDDSASARGGELLSRDSLREFQRQWESAERLPPEKRCVARAAAISTSRWLLDAAYIQEIGTSRLRKQHAQAIVEALADKALRGKRFAPLPDKFSGYWFTVVRTERMDYWRTICRRQAIDRQLARRSEKNDDSLLPLLDELRAKLTTRQQALVTFVIHDRLEVAEAVRATAERFAVTERSIQRDVAALRTLLQPDSL